MKNNPIIRIIPKITIERRREMVNLPEIQGERSQVVIGDYDGDCRRSISEEIDRRSRRATVILGIILGSFILSVSAQAMAQELSEKSDYGIALKVGGGLSYDIAGIQAELRKDHFSWHIGLGVPIALRWEDKLLSGATGFRWYQGLGEKIFIGINGTGVTYKDKEAGSNRETSIYVSALLGYRWKWEHFLVEVGAGPALCYSDEWDEIREPSGHQYYKETKSYKFWPDGVLAVGWEF